MIIKITKCVHANGEDKSDILINTDYIISVEKTAYNDPTKIKGNCQIKWQTGMSFDFVLSYLTVEEIEKLIKESL